MAKRGPSDLNLLLAVDKPVGITSHDVVSRARRALHERRVGHAGTLDPLASGVMVLGVGQATRLLGKITLDTKSYIADIAFGAETNTDDAEGEVTTRMEPTADLCDEEFATRVLAGFVGEQMQVPPAFSAISVNGVRSYKRAREGESFELPPRPVEVKSAQLIAISGDSAAPVWTVAFTVSKGTYIRSLARDIGRSCDNAAHISALRRTASGSISLGSCLALDGIDPAHARGRALDPLAVLGLKSCVLPERCLQDILCGRSVPVSAVSDSSENEGAPGSVGLVIGGELRALATVENGRFRMTDVFPQGISGVCA